MKRLIFVALLATLLAGCTYNSPYVPVYDDQGCLIHTSTCTKGIAWDNWGTVEAIAGGATAVAGLTLEIAALTR